MVFDTGVALTWILFLALFPIAFFWFRRAWRIAFRGDFSEVALKGGVPPANARKAAPYVVALNLLAGCVVAGVIFGVAAGQLDYNTWTAVAGSTLWCKFLLDFAISRQAHLQRGPKAQRGAGK